MARGAALAARLYGAMHAEGGPLAWWPHTGATPEAARDEIIIGAVLTQNTNWKNVERALVVLKAAGLSRLSAIARLAPEELAPHIRSAGYFNVKARRLGAVARFFVPGGVERFEELAGLGDAALREALLGVHGVGRETADSIMLYALGRATFVVDAYTLRIGRRHGIFGEKTTYEEARRWFMDRLPRDGALYNDYHGQLVRIGNRWCRPRPRCAGCPLARRDCAASAEAWREIEARMVEG